MYKNMADKFLNTGQGAVNLSNGTVTIIAAELGAANLQPSKAVKTNATNQLVSSDLDISDVSNLQTELTTKTELNFIENPNQRPTPPAGEIALYAKPDKKFYTLDDTGDEQPLGSQADITDNTNAIEVNAADIATINLSVPQITTNQFDIVTNSSNISINAGGIATHTLQIAQNSIDINALDQSKLSKSGGIMTGLLEATSIDFTGALNDISALELSRLDNITSNVQDQLDNKVSASTGLATLTSAEVLQLRNINAAVISSNDWLGAQYLDGTSSNIQGQLNNKVSASTGLGALTTDEVTQLRNINAAIISDQDWLGAQFLGGVTSGIQTQLNNKVSTSTGLQNLTSDEVLQLRNINNAVISIQDWEGAQFLNGVNSNIQAQISAKVSNSTGLQNLTTAEVNQLANIGDYSITSTDWRGLTYMGNVTYDVDDKFNQKLNLTGGAMSGDIAMGVNDITLAQGGRTTTFTTNTGGYLRMVNSGGILFESAVGTPKYQFPMAVSTSTPCRLTNHVLIDYSLEVNNGLTVDGDETLLEGSSGNMTGNIGLRQLYIKHPNCPSSSEFGWRLGCQVGVSASSNDMDLYFEVMRGSTNRVAAALYDQNGGTAPINFSGQHRCKPMFEFTPDMVGRIVESTGRYMKFIAEGEECSQISCIEINDALPMVRLCNTAKSKKVFGVISAEEEKNRNYQVGVFASFYDKVAGDNRIYINGLGEGAVWVSNANGNLENGDYICSWAQGYGQKQDDDILHNCTVAKITMDCDFNPQLEETKKWVDGTWVMTGEFKPQYRCETLPDGVKIAFVGCVYLAS